MSNLDADSNAIILAEAVFASIPGIERVIPESLEAFPLEIPAEGTHADGYPATCPLAPPDRDRPINQSTLSKPCIACIRQVTGRIIMHQNGQLYEVAANVITNQDCPLFTDPAGHSAICRFGLALHQKS